MKFEPMCVYYTIRNCNGKPDFVGCLLVKNGLWPADFSIMQPFFQPFGGNERNWIFRNLEFSKKFLEFSQKFLEFSEKFLEFSEKLLYLFEEN